MSLEDFTPQFLYTEFTEHEAPGHRLDNVTAVPENDTDTCNTDREPMPTHYTYPCRCSSSFVITHHDLEDGVEAVGCSGCGEWVRVLYEVAAEVGTVG